MNYLKRMLHKGYLALLGLVKKAHLVALGAQLRDIYNCAKVYLKQLITYVNRDKNKRQLRQLPWYVVLGAPQAGKKSVIANLGLYFSQINYLGIEAESYIKKFPNYNWWFSQQAVFVDIMKEVKEANTYAWKLFIKLLKCERKSKPIDGILLMFSLEDVLLYSNQKRQDFIQHICLYIREIHTVFKSQVPVYLILTKADRIEGFMEFFSDLSKEEIKQVWGMTVPLALSDESSKVLQFYHEEFSVIIDTLRTKVVWSLDAEQNPRNRELIHNFPQQLQLLRRPIETFISELFDAVSFPKALQFRGLYFCSAKQEGELQDFLLQAMSKKFQLVSSLAQRSQRMEECYFLRRLFHEVILPEAKILGKSERSQLIRKLSYQSTFFAMPFVILLTLISMHEGYKENRAKIDSVKNNIAEFEQSKFNLNPNSDSLPDLLPLLHEINNSKLAYSIDIPFGMQTLIATASIRRHITDSMQRFLNSVFIPRVAAQIETHLKQNTTDQNVLYATLKSYLAFRADSNASSDVIKAPMEYFWSQRFNKEPETSSELRYYLNLALQRPVPKLPLDEELINRIREQLEAIIPSRRAYGLLQLKASIGDLPKLLINSAVGAHFSDVFRADTNKLAIPALYTHTGFNKIFLAHYQAIAEEVAQDNQDIGLSRSDYEIQTVPQIIVAMQDDYQDFYIKHWTQALAAIQIKPFGNLKAAMRLLQLMTAGDSPMAKLFAVIYDNTHAIMSEHIQVANQFSAMNQFELGNGPVSWQATQKLLLSLQNYLMQLQVSTDVNQAEYQAVLNTIKNGKSPIIDLTLLANQVPEPIKTWLNDIANHCWNVLIVGAHTYVNALWRNDVMQAYDATIKGRYPIDSQATSEIAINDFNQFFSPKGTLNQFFMRYLKPFVETDKPRWILYQIQGHDFQISPENIALFQRSAMVINDYFANKNDVSGLSFLLKPLTLDANISSIHFVIGNHSINYSHGPQTISRVGWPLPEDNQRAQLIVSDFNGGQYTRGATGPWSIFKLLDQGDFKERQPGVYTYAININDHFASYQLLGSNDKRIYQLSDLKRFELPMKIVE